MCIIIIYIYISFKVKDVLVFYYGINVHIELVNLRRRKFDSCILFREI